MKCRALLVGPYPPPYGGVAVFNRNLHAQLRQDGWPSRVLTFSAQAGDPAIVSAAPDFPGVLRCAELLDADCRCLDSSSNFLEYPVDQFWKNVIFAWLWLKFRRGFRWIKVVHDGTLPQRHAAFSRRQKMLFKTALRAIDELVVVSAELQTWFLEQMHYRGPIQCIGSLLPVPLPEAKPGDRPAAFDEFSKTHGPVFCSIGAFTPQYGFDQVAQAVARLRKLGEGGAGLVLIDGGFASDAEFRARVLNGRDWILPLASLAHEQTLAVVRECRAFVRAVSRESFGLSRVEALWCGRPAIATKTGATQGMLLYDYGDVEALAQLLQRTLREDLGAHVREWAAFYQTEARQNLERYKCLLKPAS